MCETFIFRCDSVGTRTQDPYIKSVLLYQLSYEIKTCSFSERDAKIAIYFFQQSFLEKKMKLFIQPYL